MTASKNRSAGSGPRDDRIDEEAVTRFVRMRTGAVTDAERHELRAWLDADPAHGRAYADAETLWGTLGALPDPRRRPPPSRTARFRVRHGVALAACLLLAVCLGLWSAGGWTGLRADHATAVGETRTVSLGDGSLVGLDTDTAVTVDFDDGHRRVHLLRGRAFFTVVPDEGRPFDVLAAGGLARAVGTAFEVTVSDGVMTVAVAEGRVRVASAGTPPTGDASVLLGPGQVARHAAGAAIERRDADVARLTAWRRGHFVFADRPLREVVGELDRYRPGAILFLDSAIAEKRFTGVFGLNETDRALATIESALPVEVVRITSYLTLLRARD